MAVTLAEAAKFFRDGIPPKDYLGASFRKAPNLDEGIKWDYIGMPDCGDTARFENFTFWRCVLKFHTGGHIYERVS